MPRYLIERVFDPDLDEAGMQAIGARSKAIANEQFPQITWEHSHVVTDEDGTALSFCIYTAPNAEVVREHASLLGLHEIRNLYEIGGDVSPNDFPL
jgi:hypothetical protein